MSYSFTPSPLLAPFVADADVAALFTAEADVAAVLRFEVALAAAQARAGIIPKSAATEISKALVGHKPQLASLAAGVARDGVIVPQLVADLRKRLSANHAKALHHGATSQDAVDTSLMLRARHSVGLILQRLSMALRSLQRLDKAHGANKLMAQTRMQRALEIKVSDRLGVWEAGLQSAVAELKALRFPLQLGGPVGILANQRLKRDISKSLGLDHLAHCWQAERTPVLAIGKACAALSGACGKIGQDVALMAQNERGELTLAGGGTSSAMAHKQNPVKAEVLVSLARFSAVQIGGLHQALVHEQERSGAAWTLEFMLLPQLILASSASALLVDDVLKSIKKIGA